MAPNPPLLTIVLREVRSTDLPVLFEHQLDAEAARMAAFTPRDRDAFMQHWAKIMLSEDCASRTILFAGKVAGHIGAWTDGSARLVGYWIGREFWGRGIATAALRAFLRYEKTRPLTAHVAKHNLASIRVLEKCGFAPAGEETHVAPDGTPGEERIFTIAHL